MDDTYLGESVCAGSSKDSQKSTATTHACSAELADDSSGKSRRTYVLLADSDDDPAPRPATPPAAAHVPTFYDAISLAVIPDDEQNFAEVEATNENTDEEEDEAQSEEVAVIELGQSCREPDAAQQGYALFSETFTQTSKTIFELAQTNCLIEPHDTSAIETQTSRVSITQNKTIEYRIQVSGSRTRFTRNEFPRAAPAPAPAAVASPAHSHGGSEDSGTLRIIDDGPETNSTEDLRITDGSEDADTSKYETDFTDSLDDEVARPELGDSDASVPQSVDRVVEDLYTDLEKSFDLRSFHRPPVDTLRRGTLTPLSEETTLKVESFVSRKDYTRTRSKENQNNKVIKTTELTINRMSVQDNDERVWKLPPIKPRVRAGSPDPRVRSPAPSWHPRSPAPGALQRGPPPPPPPPPRATVPCSYWAAGENAYLASRTDEASHRGGAGWARLPALVPPARAPSAPARPRTPPTGRGDARARSPDNISIHGKIQQLKMQKPVQKHALYQSTTTESRSSSPGSARWCAGGGAGGAGGADGGAGGAGGAAAARGCEMAARGCEALCTDFIARLREACSCTRKSFEQQVSRHEGSDSCGANWAGAVELLEEIPRQFRGCWPALPEHRVADLLRLVTSQVESPRTRVARAACAALAALLSHTAYTKKPDFDEAVAALLSKTGSMASALRRAANLALDQVVAAVPPAPALSALCLLGVEHKSGLVRCAAARLLVVAAALAAGGRLVLRARPRSAADARRHTLRALAALLDDRSQDARKYAERLYALLRPLPGFEAYFLADVDTRVSCRLMRKHDPLLPR